MLAALESGDVDYRVPYLVVTAFGGHKHQRMNKFSTACCHAHTQPAGLQAPPSLARLAASLFSGATHSMAGPNERTCWTSVMKGEFHLMPMTLQFAGDFIEFSSLYQLPDARDQLRRLVACLPT